MPREDARSITFPCLHLRQPVGDFFVGVLHYRMICDIANFDVRRVIQDERDVEKYLGIQRPINANRVADLEKYVAYFDATFPTSIIIAVDADCADFNAKKSEMTLSNYQSDDGEKTILFRQIARVLDGQHRIAGLFNYDGQDFDLNVTIFVGIDIAQQAQIFSTVNIEQTKVNKSLAYDLFALAQSRSPQKTAHNIVVALDQDKESPFYRRIKRLGVATEGRLGETLTQATFVEALIKYISTDPKTDRDVLLRNGKLDLANDQELQRLPLRNMFIEKRDVEIAKLMRNYFEAVNLRWPKAWTFGGRGLILNKTNGFRALMRMFRPIYLQLAAPGEVISAKQFLEVFSKVKMKDNDFNIDNFRPGSGGEAQLTRRFHIDLGWE